MDDALHSRGKALEDLFFSEQDKKLLENLKAEIASKEQSEALSTASGIEDEATLKALVDCGITPESLTSVSLIPLVAVAWADKKMEDAEKAAILQAADVAGITTGSASYETMQSWLEKQPGPELLETWKAYIGSLKASLEDAAINQLKSSIVGRAESVAKSAGGFLGLTSPVSGAEEKVIAELNAAFE